MSCHFLPTTFCIFVAHFGDPEGVLSELRTRYIGGQAFGASGMTLFHTMLSSVSAGSHGKLGAVLANGLYGSATPSRDRGPRGGSFCLE